MKLQEKLKYDAKTMTCMHRQSAMHASFDYRAAAPKKVMTHAACSTYFAAFHVCDSSVLLAVCALCTVTC